MKDKSEYKLFLGSKIRFGQYKGESVYNIIKYDVSYMNWFLDIFEGIIDDRVKLMFKEFWERKNFEKHGFRNDVNYVKTNNLTKQK